MTGTVLVKSRVCVCPGSISSSLLANRCARIPSGTNNCNQDATFSVIQLCAGGLSLSQSDQKFQCIIHHIFGILGLLHNVCAAKDGASSHSPRSQGPQTSRNTALRVLLDWCIRMTTELSQRTIRRRPCSEHEAIESGAGTGAVGGDESWRERGKTLITCPGFQRSGCMSPCHRG